jgi:hypothetical protein
MLEYINILYYLNPAMSNSHTPDVRLHPKRRLVNVGGFFNLNQPSDGAGIELSSFCLYQTYRIERSEVERICKKLSETVFAEIDKGRLADARVRLTGYRENIRNEERTYIVITRDTICKTRATIYMRFLSYGDNLYVGIDTYVLGKLNWIALVFRILLFSILGFPGLGGVLGAFSLLFVFGNFFAAVATITIPILQLTLLTYLFWQKFIRRCRIERKIGLALRQEFPGVLGNGPFDLDDVLMFVKSTLHTAIDSVRDVFKEEGLPLESLDAFAQSINNSINISTGGGALSMVGSMIGMGNKAK